MDPPLSHTSPFQVNSISVIRGISPVSAGAESIGGTIRAKTARLRYSANGKVASHGSLSTGYDSNNNADTLGGQLGISSDSDRLQLNGNISTGQDMKAGNGRDVLPTQYKRRNFGADYGHHFGDGKFNLGYHHERVDNAGTPALPMDSSFVKGSTVSASYQSSRVSDSKRIKWLANIHYMNTDHRMDNFSLRSAPLMLGMMSMPMKRLALTNVKDFAYKLHAAIPIGNDIITLGTEAWMVEHQADVYDPGNAGFHLQNFNGVKRNRFGLFIEWKSALTSSLQVQAGIRYSRVNMNAGAVSASGFAGMMATAINTGHQL